MARSKNNSPQAKRNRNNRKRGASFEKKVAEILDMEVVPYSGTNSRFGWQDVRDSEGKNDAWWMGECKNRVYDQSASFTIEQDWIDKMKIRAYDVGALPFLAFMKAGRPEKFILLDHRTFDILTAMSGPIICSMHSIEYEKGSHNQVNVKIPQHDLTLVAGSGNNILKMRLIGMRYWYYVMSIQMFRHLLEATGYHHKWAKE